MRMALFNFLLAAALVAVVWWLGGGGIAGLGMLSILLALPACQLARKRIRRAVPGGAGLVVGMALTLLLGARSFPVPERLMAGVVLAAWLLGLLGAGLLLIPRPRRRRGARRVTLLCLAAWLWITFPIWLGAFMADRGWDVPAFVSSLHPLFALNAAAPAEGIWAQQPIAYQFTPLGQGVDYALPKSLLPFVTAHLVVLVVGGIARWWRK